MTGPCAYDESEAGFTLVEMLAAMAVAALMLGAVLTAVSQSFARFSEAQRLSEASLIAQSLLTRFGSDLPLIAGQRSGQEAGRFEWQIRATPFVSPQEKLDQAVRPLLVTVEVGWDDAGRRKSYELETVLLAGSAARR
jgi:general secretion pathway protein I